MPKHHVLEDYYSPLPYTYLSPDDLPESFSWSNISGGVSYLTHSLNQHLPHYCGSCWAHAALSSLADRIKIARGGGGGDDINLSIQYILNCGSEIAGTCHGGTSTGVYEFIKEHSSGFIPYDTCQPYMACSHDSNEGFCPHGNWTCSAMNTCRTCTAFAGRFHMHCSEIDFFPNATIAEFGTLDIGTPMSDDKAMNATQGSKIQAEIYARGPVAAAVNGRPLHDYTGGIFTNDTASKETTHMVSLVGWGVDPTTLTKYWIARNSWGSYWGEMGYFRIEMGKNVLGIESQIVWATPGQFTVNNNVPCSENGSNCGPTKTFHYVDPSVNVSALKILRLQQQQQQQQQQPNNDPYQQQPQL